MKDKQLRVYLASPRGFCAGVDRAIEIVKKSLEKYGSPVYVSEGNELHRYGHMPINHKSSTAAGDHLIVPCDDEIVLNLFSHTSDYSDLNSTYWGVQHSFWLPEWGVKEDLVPGLEGGTLMWFMPDDPGTFNIRCAEYCGLDHSKMVGYVDVVSWFDEETREYQNCDADTGVKKEGGAN